MEKLLELLKDGHARTCEMLAMELDTSIEDIERKLEYLENMGVIKRVAFQIGKCGNCSGCPSHELSSSPICKGCMPEGGFKNMGEMWEVVAR